MFVTDILNEKSRAALPVLVDGDEAFVQKSCFVGPVNAPDIGADDQRGSKECPHGKVLEILLIAATADADVSFSVHANDKHVQIIVAAGSVALDVFHLLFEDILIASRHVENVSGGTVGVSASGAHPARGIVFTPVAGGKKDVAAGVAKGHSHGEVSIFCIAAYREVTEIIFQVINTPFGELAGILEFVTVAAGIACTGFCSCTGIHAKFQSFGMNIIGKCFHSAGEKLWIRNELSVHTLF